MSDSKLKLEQEAIQASLMLKGKVVAAIIRHRESEVLIQFTDGTRLFVDQIQTGIELSITGAIHEPT